MLILVYTMCQYMAPEPASVQTQVFTHRYGFKIFINSAFILILTRFFYRCARRNLLMCAMTQVWSKLCNTVKIQRKYLTFVWENCDFLTVCTPTNKSKINAGMSSSIKQGITK